MKKKIAFLTVNIGLIIGIGYLNYKKKKNYLSDFRKKKMIRKLSNPIIKT